MTHNSPPQRRAVFLDRDGTINVEVQYLHRVVDFALVPGAPAAIKRLNDAGFAVVVVTNQAGIARGYYTEAALHELHEHLVDVLAVNGARLDAIYYCPHHPDFGGACPCRKPAPGMLLQAAREHNLDLARSWLVGDSASDVAAGHAAGCRTILVRTGYGAAHANVIDQTARPEIVVDDIGAAATYILADDSAA